MNIDSIRTGYVIDHIEAGKGMELYRLLGLDNIDCPVAMIMHAQSRKLGKKDIIKIDGDIVINWDVIGYVDPHVTVNVIRDGRLLEKKTITKPATLTNVIRCKNPRCITSSEPALDQIFTLSDQEDGIYRCIYCESKQS